MIPYPTLTPIQSRALPLTRAGRHVLILAPTGSGKTLAGFAALLERLAGRARADGLPNQTLAVYVSPLKALTRDIHRNLTPLLDGLSVRVAIRTGDTEAAERGRLGRSRPHLLLTTPESLSSLLSQSAWRGGFAPEAVVVDELHALAESKRGSLLALALERLEAHAPAAMQRIGLSATARPPEAAARLLFGARPYELAAVNIARAHRLRVADPPPGLKLPAAGYLPVASAPLAAELVARARCTLLFTSTRSAAERLTVALKHLLPREAPRIGVHHASLDPAARQDTEDRLARGELKAVVCSSSLELGVDYQAVDQVLLIGTPRGVSRALQRLGRSGHRPHGVAEGWLIPLSLPDLLECAAAAEAARRGKLDDLRIPSAPLDVLAQTLLGMAVEREWGLEEAWTLVRRAGPYLELPREDFNAVIEYLAGGGRVLGPSGAYGKIDVHDGRFRAASKTVARAYFQNIGAISGDYSLRVVTRGNRRVGEVEESFLAGLPPGEPFILGGRTLRLKSILQNTALAEPVDAAEAHTPRWMGGRMPLSARLAAEEIRLRRALRDAAPNGEEAVARLLRDDWRLGPEASARAAAYVLRQARAAGVPADAPILVERLRPRKQTVLIVFHSVAGRAVNRSLAWVAAHRFASGRAARPGVAAHFDDHAFLLSIAARLEPPPEEWRAWFHPDGFARDLRAALEATEALGRKFRAVAETGQLLPRRTFAGPRSPKSSAWSASLLYSALMKYEPGHPLLREAVRETLEDQLDAAASAAQAARMYAAPWDVRDLPRPSPFALPLFAGFHREALILPDPAQAVEELAARLYEEWAP